MTKLGTILKLWLPNFCGNLQKTESFNFKNTVIVESSFPGLDFLENTSIFFVAHVRYYHDEFMQNNPTVLQPNN